MKYSEVFLHSFVIVSTALVVSCSKQAEPEVRTQTLSQAPGATSVAGITWGVPGGWTVQPAKQMRIATYAIPGGDDSTDAGECAIFYFGKREGGDVESNIGRWAGQFELSGEPVRSSKVVNGLKVSLVDISGTYRGMAGPMMPSGDGKKGYRLLGAIVEAPEGLVFFKFTGPAGTVFSAQEDFDNLIESVEEK